MSLTSLIPTGGEFCVLRAQVVDSLIACCDGDSALLYLYLVRKGPSFDEREALRTLGMTRDRYDRAVHTLTSAMSTGFFSAKISMSTNGRWTIRG